MNSLKQTLLAKLRRPIHVSYISRHLVKLPIDKTMDMLNEMVEEGLVEESKYGKGYYVIKQNK
jgi:DNA-binding IclR family transcriptional regulator